MLKIPQPRVHAISMQIFFSSIINARVSHTAPLPFGTAAFSTRVPFSIWEPAVFYSATIRIGKKPYNDTTHDHHNCNNNAHKTVPNLSPGRLASPVVSLLIWPWKEVSRLSCTRRFDFTLYRCFDLSSPAVDFDAFGVGLPPCNPPK